MGRLKVKEVKSVGNGKYWAMNPLAAKALHLKGHPRHALEVQINNPHRKADLKHERHEYQKLKQIEKKHKLTKKDYLKAHRQTVREGYP